MKDYDENKELPYLQYWDVTNLLGQEMLQKLIKYYNELSNEGCFFEVDIHYLDKLHKLHNDLPFLPERVKTKKLTKLAANLHNKTEYVIHIINLKEASNHGLVF